MAYLLVINSYNCPAHGIEEESETLPVCDLMEATDLLMLAVLMAAPARYGEVMEQWNNALGNDVCGCGNPDCANVVINMYPTPDTVFTVAYVA